MKRNAAISPSHYLEARISQLREDKDKASEEYDKMWYNRVIQELTWFKQIIDGKEK